MENLRGLNAVKNKYTQEFLRNDLIPYVIVCPQVPLITTT